MLTVQQKTPSMFITWDKAEIKCARIRAASNSSFGIVMDDDGVTLVLDPTRLVCIRLRYDTGVLQYDIRVSQSDAGV